MTQAVLLGSAILMAIPSVMVFLSLALKAKANRSVNIILGFVHIGILAGSLFVGRISILYIFYVVVEAVLIALIVWHAWKWPKQEA
jgi:poly(A) polymerase Pap1